MDPWTFSWIRQTCVVLWRIFELSMLYLYLMNRCTCQFINTSFIMGVLISFKCEGCADAMVDHYIRTLFGAFQPRKTHHYTRGTDLVYFYDLRLLLSWKISRYSRSFQLVVSRWNPAYWAFQLCLWTRKRAPLKTVLSILGIRPRLFV